MPEDSARTASATRRSRPWLAALLAVVTPGLGHLYVWRTRAAIAVLAIALLVGMSVQQVLIRIPGPWTLAGVFILMFALYGMMAGSAWYSARTYRGARPGRARLTLVLLAYVFATGLLSEGISSWSKRNVAQPFRIPGVAMEPTLIPGDWVFARPLVNARPVRDRIYAYRYEGETWLMRVVALEGDTLRMISGTLIRNGEVVVEPYAHRFITAAQAGSLSIPEDPRAPVPNARPTGTIDDWGPYIVPPDSVFVLGDNRHESRDSRYTGPVAADSVVGEPLQVYFSWEPGVGIRWERVGLTFD